MKTLDKEGIATQQIVFLCPNKTVGLGKMTGHTKYTSSEIDWRPSAVKPPRVHIQVSSGACLYWLHAPVQ